MLVRLASLELDATTDAGMTRGARCERDPGRRPRPATVADPSPKAIRGSVAGVIATRATAGAGRRRARSGAVSSRSTRG